MNDLYNKINSIFNFYNSISDNKLSREDFVVILPKLLIIISNIKLDIVDIIQIIDTLLEFKEYQQLDKINKETIYLLKKITNNKFFKLEGSIYLSVFLKHLLLHFNLNKCKNNYEKLLHISTFETLVELLEKFLNNDDLSLLRAYNFELSELIIQYKLNKQLYNQTIHNEIILKTMMTHFYSIFYFNLDEYDYNYRELGVLVNNSINNYQQFINYCYNEEICDNFTKIVLETNEIEKEYEVCKKMLDYVFNDLQKEKKKRKC